MDNRLGARFDAALQSASVKDALMSLARALKGEGYSQLELYRALGEIQAHMDGDDPRYDAVLEMADAIHGGPWAKEGALFETELDEGDL